MQSGSIAAIASIAPRLGSAASAAYRPQLVRVADLKPHEQIFAERIPALRRRIVAAGAWEVPILVERTSGTIMDGHHRWTVARDLNLALVPAVLLDYSDPRLSLGSWSDRVFTPADIIAAALSGRLMPQKSTRHRLDPSVPLVDVPLSQLTGDAPARRLCLQ